MTSSVRLGTLIGSVHYRMVGMLGQLMFLAAIALGHLSQPG